MQFRIFTNKTTILSAYDGDAFSGEYKSRKGMLYDIEIWLHWFSFTFAFIRWTERE